MHLTIKDSLMNAILLTFVSAFLALIPLYPLHAVNVIEWNDEIN